jgi:hypothetical protein
MTEANTQPQQPSLDEALRQRILDRTASVNAKLISRLSTVANDLAEGDHASAHSTLGGLERRIYAMRSLLLLLL